MGFFICLLLGVFRDYLCVYFGFLNLCINLFILKTGEIDVLVRGVSYDSAATYLSKRISLCLILYLARTSFHGGVADMRELRL